MRTSTLGSHLRHIDLYAILGVRPDASADEIRRGYRRGALEAHPDRHPNDRQAADRFLLLTQARDVLLDADLRAAYDELRGLADRHEAAARPGNPHAHRPVRRNAADPLTEHRLARKAQRTRSAAELTALWRIGSTVVKASILRNIACPVSLFGEACVAEHWMLGLEAANRAGCPVHVLDKLALSFERSVALAVASHPATSGSALGTVASRHRDLPILQAIALHQNANAEVLREVGKAVRGPRTASLGCAVIAHPLCPPDVAQRIRQRLGNMVA